MTLRYSVNLSLLYNEHPFLDRFALAARAGFRAVEFQFPYEFDLLQVKARLEDHGLALALFNLHAGDRRAGEWGSLSNPNKRDYFRWSLTNALDAARLLGCSRLNTMFGQRIAGLELETQFDCAVENLAWAAHIAEQAGVALLIEPLNATDFPEFALRFTNEALGIIQRVGHPRVRLQYDLYHAQMTEGNLINTFTRCLPLIGHIQLADVPGRHQPGTGEINYPAVLAAIGQLNYEGYIGLEHWPLGPSDASLAWLSCAERQAE